MPRTAALYGFEFTKPFMAGGLQFVPIVSDHSLAQARARDLRAHHLVGTVSAPELSPMKRFHLEGILSFIEHLEVLVSEPVDDDAAFEHPTLAGVNYLD